MMLIVSLSGLLLWLVSPVASAHLLDTGLGPVVDGALHPFVTGTELMLLIGVTLLAAQQLQAQCRWVLVIVPVGFLAGVGLQALTDVSPLSDPFIVSLILIGIGLLVAIRVRLPQGLVFAICAMVFVCSGLEAKAAADNALVLVGNLGALFAALSIGLAVCQLANVGWPAIALRALGSWLAATALLLLGWTSVLQSGGFG